jgi:hypothetical protein
MSRRDCGRQRSSAAGRPQSPQPEGATSAGGKHPSPPGQPPGRTPLQTPTRDGPRGWRVVDAPQPRDQPPAMARRSSASSASSPARCPAWASGQTAIDAEAGAARIHGFRAPPHRDRDRYHPIRPTGVGHHRRDRPHAADAAVNHRRAEPPSSRPGPPTCAYPHGWASVQPSQPRRVPPSSAPGKGVGLARDSPRSGGPGPRMAHGFTADENSPDPAVGRLTGACSRLRSCRCQRLSCDPSAALET